MKEVLTTLREYVFDVSSKLTILREYLSKLNENIASCRKLSSLYQELNEKILQMYENVPEELITAYVKINNNKLIESNSNNVSNHSISTEIHQNVGFNDVLNVQEPVITDCKKELFSEPRYPKISLLREDEFSKIPKYMIGRQSLDKVNNLVISINKVLTTKYSLLYAGKQAAKKKGQLDLYLQYKKQDIICESCGCKYFFTAEDYESSTKTKLDRAALNVMMALRHCKRIREYRSKKELYYIVID